MAFLSKPDVPRTPARYPRPSGIGAAALLLPVLCAGFLLQLQRDRLRGADTGSRDVGGAVARTLGSNADYAQGGTLAEATLLRTDPDGTRTYSDGSKITKNGTKVLADGTTGTPPRANPCTEAAVNAAFKDGKVFPVVPAGIDADTAKGCTPPDWTALVFMRFAQRFLLFLNWVAATFAVLLTLYAGLLYISAGTPFFGGEGQAKKAKTVLYGAYSGLFLVIASRLLVYGTINLVTDDANVPQTVKDAGTNLP